MKKILIALLVLIAAYLVGAAVLAVASGQAEGAVLNAEKQILADGDMEESGIGSWSEYHISASKVAGAAYDGKQILRISYAGNAVGSAYQAGYSVGTTYRVTGWARSSGAPIPEIRTNTMTIWTGAASTEWQPIDAVFVYAGNGNFQLGSSNFGTSSYVEFDDVFVTEYAGDMTNADQQILTDGDMEDADTSAWTAHTYATISKEAGASVDGRQLMRVTNNSAAAHTMAFNQDALTVGQTYKVTGWMRKSVSVSANVFVTLGNVHAWDGDLTSTDWQYFEGVAVADDTPVKFYGGFMDIGEYAEWDDIVVTEYAGETVQQEKQLLPDGDMEDAGVGNWAALSSTISKESGTAVDGKTVLRITTTDSGNAAYYNDSTLTIGKRYRVTGWTRTDSSRVVTIGDRGSSSRFCYLSSVGTDWTWFDCIATAGHEQFRLAAGDASAGQWGEFDDVFITEL